MEAKAFVATLARVIEATADGSLAAAKARAITGLLKLRLDAESLSISAKLLRRQLTPDDNRRLVDEALAEIGQADIGWKDQLAL